MFNLNGVYGMIRKYVVGLGGRVGNKNSGSLRNC